VRGVRFRTGPLAGDAGVKPARSSYGQETARDNRLQAGATLATIGTMHASEPSNPTSAAVWEEDARLRQVTKMEAVGRLAGGVAHDFNNLLTAILGYTNLVLDELGADHPSRPDVEQIRHAAESAASLTRQLLAFSRRQLLQPQVLDLNRVVQSMESLLRRLIGAHIDLQTNLDVPLWRIHADQGQLEQVLMNLAINARDAMPSGGRLLIATSNIVAGPDLVHANRGLTPGHYVQLEISDNGTGMDETVLAHLFEPFFTTKRRGEGTGLGLATVYGIIKQSGGYVAVQSQPGVGTTFTIYLPQTTQEEMPLGPIDRSARTRGGSETILLVEDQPEVRAIARTMLTRQGYRVLEAEGGSEALALVASRKEPIHLLLTDVIMPALGGQDLAVQLLPMRPDMRVLFASGYTDDALVQQGVLQPGADLIQKPFSREALLQKVRAVLDGPRQDFMSRA
jgi:two-component system cell cycle sensor histidine kinase/response regulator CckA